MFSQWMNTLFLYFDLLGFCSQYKVSRNRWKFDLFILTSHTILGLLTTLIIISYLMRPVDDQMGVLNDLLKFSVLFFVHWLSIIELHSKQKTQRKFWQYFWNIDQQFCSHHQFRLRNFLKKIKIYFTVSTFAYFIFLHRLLANSGVKFLTFWLSYVFMVLIYQNRSFYYFFYLECVRYELKMVDHEIGEMLFHCNSGKWKNIRMKKLFMSQFHRKRFKWIREYFGLIYEMCNTINSVFGWSNVAVIICSFHLILYDINWFYWKLLNKYEFNMNGNDSPFIRRR